jgi:thiamine-monophosphate kinase
MRLAELGEAGLLARLTRALPGGSGVICGPGDDAAVLDLGGPEAVLFTTDTLVEEVHFSRAYISFRDLGYKSLAVSLSDIAAMGGRPTHAVVSLAVPAGIAVADIEELYAGLDEAAGGHGVSLVGGDTVRHPYGIVITVALLGLAERGRVLYRGGAAPGDLFCVTGDLGASAAGLFLFQNPGLGCPPEVERRLKAAHRRPKPRVAAGHILAASDAVTAAEDVSDGLAASLAHVCAASGVGCRLRAELLPICAEVLALGRLTGKDPLEWVLSGGEDYELLYAVRPAAAGEVEGRLVAAGETVTWIGEALEPGAGLWIEHADGTRRPLVPAGYDAFRVNGV